MNLTAPPPPFPVRRTPSPVFLWCYAREGHRSQRVLGCHVVGCAGGSRGCEWTERMLGDSRVGGSSRVAVALSRVLCDRCF